MALYVGEAVRIRVDALDPETGEPLSPAPTSAVVDFWAPGKDPVKNLADRGSPDVQNQTMTYRSTEDDFVLYQDTSGGAPWVDGKWTFRVTVTGATYTNWEFGSFKLKP